MSWSLFKHRANRLPRESGESPKSMDNMDNIRTMRLRPMALTIVLVLAGLWMASSQEIVRAAPNATSVDVDRGAAGLSRALRALRTRAGFLHITAHPDDEDGGML